MATVEVSTSTEVVSVEPVELCRSICVSLLPSLARDVGNGGGELSLVVCAR